MRTQAHTHTYTHTHTHTHTRARARARAHTHTLPLTERERGRGREKMCALRALWAVRKAECSWLILGAFHINSAVILTLADRTDYKKTLHCCFSPPQCQYWQYWNCGTVDKWPLFRVRITLTANAKVDCLCVMGSNSRKRCYRQVPCDRLIG